MQHIKPLLLNLIFLLLTSSALMAQTNTIPDTFVYRKIGYETLKAYVFKPVGKGKHPAILLFHGGAWRLGEAAWTFDRAKQFAERGMVAIAIEYRLANNGLTPINGVDDACAAFAWARSLAVKLGIDTKRVVGYGVSAGGHLVAAAALIPAINGIKIPGRARPNALMLYSPALNMAHDNYFVGLMAGKGDPASYSPSEYISKKLVPTLIIQGEKDSIVFAKDATAFRDAAVKAGAKCILFVYPGVGHLLTRNLKIQYKDFDPDPAMVADAFKKENDFLVSIGYIPK
ncbi:alpha/beta hydrolase [Mucilaginibacter sp. OK098]|uniref:alpha/beta hydrolase n=1 Tax=Mucilaginibacter sp. OK098 TaxID=1855297 RepID=UPI000918CF3F|nr:alpha/beta hydrolase [Mucilaginibacter sp. OK098]SHN27559.1 Acetyl esterase/lipase [Mucilaginibacter sp. OK098]